MKTHLKFLLSSFYSVSLFCILGINKTHAQVGETLNFDGTNDYVQIPSISFGNNWTTEAWIQPTNSSSPWWNVILGQCRFGPAPVSGFVFGVFSGVLFVEGPTGFNMSTPITQGVWTHVALTYNNGILAMYKNGVLAGTQVISFINSSNPFLLGIRTNNSNSGVVDPYQGNIDEVRIWNTTRSQCQIQQYMNSEIPGSSPGLVANYHFNQGVSGALSILNYLTGSLFGLDDDSGNGNTGTLTNFGLTLNGTSNWTGPGSPAQGITTPASASTSEMDLFGNGNPIVNGSMAPNTSNYTDFDNASTRTFVINNTGAQSLYVGTPILTGASANQFSVTVPPATLVTAGGTTSFVVAFTPTSTGVKTATLTIYNLDCSEPFYAFAVSAAIPAEALHFDQSLSNKVIVPPGINVSNQSFSVEFWAKRTNTLQGYAVGTGTNVFGSNDALHIGFRTGNDFTFAFYGNDLNITSPLTSDGLFHHYACVYDATATGMNRFIYIDGVLAGQNYSPVHLQVPAGLPLIIGDAGYYSTGFPNPLSATLDELRIWGAARSQCEIQAYMNCEIPTTATNLIANYHFNQGDASGLNTTETTLLDATGAHNGTLSNFNLSGSTSNWVEPGGVTASYTTAAPSEAEMNVTGDGILIPDGATTSSVMNYTDFNGSFSRNFSIQNTFVGGILNLGSPYLTGPNANQFTITTIPSLSITGPMSSNIGVSFIPTTPGAKTATVNIPSNDCDEMVYSFVITATATAGAALDFDGSSDYVAINHSAAFNFSNTITIEAWVKNSDGSVEQPITTKHEDSWHLAINGGNGGAGRASFYLTGVSGSWLRSSTIISDGNWHHVAASYNGSMIKLYVDGILENQVAASGNIAAGSNSVYIGYRPAFGAFYPGTIDELRFWNTERSQCEIQSYMNCEIPASATGLVANYHFNEGMAEQNNSGIINLPDLSGGANNGTLYNFNLMGSTTNWVAPGAVISGSSTPASITSSLVVKGNGLTIAPGSVVTSTNNFTNFGSSLTRTFVVENPGTGNLYINYGNFTSGHVNDFSVTTIPSQTLGTSATSSFVVTFSPTATGTRSAMLTIYSSDCNYPSYNFLVEATAAPAEALDFNGTDDYVEVSNTPALNTIITGNFSFEAWVKPTNAKDNTIISKGHGGGLAGSGEYIFQIKGSNQLAFFHTSLNGWKYSSGTIPLNAWSHVAATFDGVHVKFYINGLLDATIASSVGIHTTGSSPVYIARQGSVCACNYFQGALDEVRVWSIPRTQCEIQTYMHAEIPSTASGLVANYHFNQGIPFGANPTTTLLTDGTGVNTGTLVALNLSGTTSNWVSPGGVTSGATLAVQSGATLSISGNGNPIPPASFTPLLSNFTDYGTASTRTFVLENTGTGTLYIGNGLFSGANAGNFVITAVTSTVLTTGASASLVINFTPSTAATHTAVFTVFSSDCTAPEYSFALSATPPPGEALHFDGTDDIISRPAFTALSSSVTLQARVFIPSTQTTNQTFVYNGHTSLSGYGFYLPANSPELLVLYGGNYWHPTGYTLTPNQWHALTMTLENGALRVYANGLLAYTNLTVTAFGASFPPAPPTDSFVIGANQDGNEDFSGTVDEVYVWSKVLSQCEIQSYLNSEVPAATPGLVAAYHFNQGAAAGPNTTITTVTDGSGNNNHLAISGFSLTGASSNFVAPGAVVSGNTISIPPTASISLSGNGNAIANNAAATTTLNHTNFSTALTRTFVVTNSALSGTLHISTPYLTGPGAADFSVTVLPSTSLTSLASTSFVVAFTPTAAGTSSAVIHLNDNDCGIPIFNFAIEATPPVAEALDFTGAFTYITTTGQSLDNQSFTIEFQAKRPSTATNDYVFAQGTANTLDGLHIGFYGGTDYLSFDLWNIAIASSSTDNLWHHWACVFEYSASPTKPNVFIYKDGVLDASGIMNGYTGTGTSYIGNTPWALATDGFTGVLDELRIWNTARTQCEIQTYMNCEIPTTAPGLISNYHFNQGSPGLDNTSETALIDATGAFNGTFNNFPLTGASSNFVSPGAVASGYTTTSAPTASISVAGNGNAITDNAVTTTTLNHTNFGSAFTRTFVITNSALSGTLNIGTPYLTGPNAADFSVTVLPSASLTSLASTSFVITFIPTSAGTSSAVIHFNDNDCGIPIFNFAIQATPPVAEILNFDGFDDHIVTATTPNFNMTTAATIEGWFKTSINGADKELFRLENGSNEGIEAGLMPSGQFFFSAYLGSTWVPFVSTGPALDDGSWHHYAVVSNGNNVTAYIDGAFIGTSNGPGSLNTGSSYLMIGRHPYAGFNFAGDMDDIRVWNVARTQCEIQAYMNCEIPGTASGLVANYHFNQGIPGMNNSSENTLLDAAGSNNGTLNNVSLNGSTSNWLAPGKIVPGYTTAVSPTASITLSGNGNTIADNAVSTATLNHTNFGSASTRTFVITNSSASGTLHIGTPYLTGPNAADFSVTVVPASSLTTLSTTSFVVAYTPTASGTSSAVIHINDNDCSIPIFNFAIQATPPPAAALSFDGVDDDISLPVNAAFDFTTGTVEAWINLTGGNINNNCIASVRTNSTARWSLHVNETSNQIDIYNTITVGTIPVNLNPNTWYHIAAVITPSDMTLYVNGTYAGTTPVGLTSTITGLPLNIGTTNRFPLDNERFNGIMDEVRIWNDARTQCEIQSYMNCEIPTTASNLIANYHFNQGAAALNNSSETLLLDAAGTNNGPLANFSLTGAASNWVAPGGVVSGFTTTAIPSASIALSGNGNSISNNAVTTATLNHTNFGTALTRTFVITNSALSGTLAIAPPYITGPNAADFSITVLPASYSLTTLATSSFVVAYTPTAGGTSSAVVHVNDNDCGIPIFNFAIEATPPAAEALEFDGGNDLVTVPGISLNNKSFTIEFWAKRTGTGTNIVVAQGSSFTTNTALHIGFRQAPGNEFTFAFYSNDINYTTSATSDMQYHHWACVYDNTASGMNRFVYLDGVLLTSDHTNSPFIGSGPFVIGDVGYSGNPYEGFLDELRVWDVARTQCEIQTYMNCEIAGSMPNLIGNYHFNQGAAGLNNSAVTTLLDDAATPNNGTLSGFALNGPVSNWVVPGKIVSGYTTTSAPSASITVAGNGNSIAGNAVTTTTLNHTDFGSALTRTFVITNASASGTLHVGTPYLTGPNASDFSVTVPPSLSLTASATTSFVISFVPTSGGTSSAVIHINDNDCNIPIFNFAIQASPAPGEALSFDGTTDQIQIPDVPAMNFGPGTDMTIEAMVQFTANHPGFHGVVVKADASGGWYGYQLAIVQNKVAAELSSPIGFLTPAQGLLGTRLLNDGLWHHLALVVSRSDARAKLYVDGILEASATGNGASGNYSVPVPTFIGSERTSAGFINGKIDEVRIWGSARSQCELQSYMHCEIPGGAPGLVANYHFNQGAAGLNNPTETSLTDAAGTNNGTLLTFNLSGGSSNWVAPGGVVTGFTTAALPSASIALTGNGNSIADNAVTTSTLNHTDFGTALTRTFVITNTALSGTLHVSNPYITGPAAASFSVTVLPSSYSLASSATTSFVVAYTPTSTATASAVIQINDNDCGIPIFNFAIQATPPVAEALIFDGSNDYVQMSDFNIGTNDFTIESWIKPNDVTTHQHLITNRTSEGGGPGNYFVFNIDATGLLTFAMAEDNSGMMGVLQSPSPLATAAWQHIAVTRSGTVISMYINGLLVNQLKDSFVRNLTAGPGIGILGAAPFVGGAWYNGEMDNTRIWHTARTQCEIQSYMNCEIPATAPGLVANYHFNQGLPGLSNPTETLLIDAAAVNTGTLYGFDLNGTASNWISPSQITSGYTTAIAPTASITVKGNSTGIADNSTVPSLSNHTDFGSVFTRTFVIENSATGTLNIGAPYLTGPNASDFSVTILPSGSLSALATTSFVVAFTPTSGATSSAVIHINNNDCNIPVFDFAIQATPPVAEALNFDGVDDYLELPVQDFTAGDKMTLEAWVKPSNITTNVHYHIMRQDISISAVNWLLAFQNNGTQLSFGLNTSNGGYNELDVPINPAYYTDGNWHHIAAVYDGAFKHIYVDGVQIGMQPKTGTVTGGHLVNSLGRANYYGEFFEGDMDEVRFWNTARTQCEIQSYMNCEIPAGATGLTANYHFNQGIPSGFNSGLTSLTDAAGVNTGTLTFFALTTGSVSNWVSPGAVAPGYTTVSAPAASITLAGNGNSIADNATTTSTLNFTHFGSALTRTFVITNTALSGTLHISAPYISGPNAADFSVTVVPSLSLSSMASTSFVVAYTPTASGTSSAVVYINDNDCSIPIFNFAIEAIPPMGEALHFGGLNDHIRCQGPIVSTFTNGVMTGEAWVKMDVTSSFQSILKNWGESNGVNGAFHFGAALGTNNIEIYMTQSNGVEVMTADPVPLNTGTWYHLAFVADGTYLRLYKNGVQVGTPVSYDGTIKTSQPGVFIGCKSNDAGTAPSATLASYWHGSMDEIRIWNVARSQCDIQSYMNCEIPGSAPGLVANYHFNQGAAGLSNPTETLLIDAAGVNTGTLGGFTLAGNTSNWILPGAVISGSTTPGIPSATLQVTGNAINIPHGNTATGTANFTDFGTAATRTFVAHNPGTNNLYINSVTLSGANAASFYILTQPSQLVAGSGSSNFVISFSPTALGSQSAIVTLNSSDCTSPNYSFVISASATPGSALDFDGVDDYVDLGNSALLKPTTALTAEAWVNSATWPAVDQTFVGNTENNGYGLLTRNATGNLEAYVRRNNTWAIVGTPVSAITPGWHHVAVTYDGRYTRLYLDGALQGTDDAGATYTINYNSSNNTLIGAEASGGSTPVPGWYFTGKIDEVRIWDRALCQAELQHNLHCEVSATGNGLVANYHFNEGIASGINTTVSTLPDFSGNTLTGSLMDMVKTGPSSNWVSPGAVTSGSSCSAFVSSEIELIGNGVSIPDGDITPALSDHTDYGAVCSNTIVVRTYTLQNTGAAALSVSSMSMSGTNASLFTIGALSPPSPIPSNSAAVFSVTFAPLSAGVKTATLNIQNNDCDETSYDVVLTGTANALPTVTASASASVFCEGTGITLNGAGADTYTWTGGISNAVSFTPAVSQSYTLSGTYTLTGCTSTNLAVQSITVNPIPSLTISAVSPTICSGTNATLTASGAATYTWNAGAFTGGTITPSPASDATYTLQGSSAAGCTSTNTAVQTISVFTTPTITATSSNTSICEGFTATLSVNGTSTYSWYPGPLNGGTITPSPAASTSYTSVGYSSNGCVSNSVILTVTVNPLPIVVANTTHSAICNGFTTSVFGSGADTYTWSPLVSDNTAFTPTITTSYTVTGTNALTGCTSTNLAVQTITVDNTPTVSISSGSTICEGSTATLTASGALSYTWEPGTLTASSIVVSPAATTIYTLSGSSLAGCTNTNTATETVSVNALPTVTASISSSTICEGASITLTGSGAQTYTWTGGAPDAVAFVPSATTDYTLSGTNSAGCTNTNLAVASVTVNAIPTVTANATHTAVCDGFTTSVYGSGADTYTWLPSGITDNLAFIPAATADYTVTGTYTLTGCTSTNLAVVNILVDNIPTVSIVSGSTICEGSSATLMANGATSYTWEPGTIVASNITVSPSSTTIYTVSGTNLAGCTSTNLATETVSVNALPSVTAAISNSVICEDGSITLTGSGAQTYTWTGGAVDGVAFVPAASGSYTLTGTNSAGCTNTNLAVADVTVNPLPVVTANTTNSVICSGFTTSVYGSGADTYTWTGGVSDGVAFTPAATLSYSLSGTYTLTGCTSTNLAVQTITVESLPVVAIASNSTICEGSSATLIATGAASYTWNPGPVMGNNVAVSPGATLVYTVTGENLAGCTSTNLATMQVSVNALPSVTASVSNSVICANQTITVNGSGASTYTWTGGVTDATSFTPTASADYTLTGTDLAGCTSTNLAVASVTVNSLPSLTVTVSNSVICLGGQTNLSAAGASTYSWSGTVVDNVAFSPTVTASYTVVGTNTNSCENTAVTTVTVNNLPVLTVTSSPLTSCEAETATISVTGANSYTWSTNEYTADIVVSPTVTSVYTVTATDLNGCVNTFVYTQSVTPCPGTFTATATVKNVSCAGKKDGEITIAASSSYTNPVYSYIWIPASLCPNNDCDTLTTMQAGTYSLTVKITYTVNGTLVKTDSIVMTPVVLVNLSESCDVDIYNGVTPNGDDVNDVFTIKNIEQFPKNKVMIYNRWGTLLSEISGYNNTDKAWPLKAESDKLSSGTYFYLLDLGDGSKVIKGWVEVLKN